MKRLITIVFSGLMALTLTLSAVAQPIPASKTKLTKAEKKARQEQAKAAIDRAREEAKAAEAREKAEKRAAKELKQSKK